MFRFRLQRLLELREQREQHVAVQSADAERAAAAARTERDALETLRSDASARLSAAQGVAQNVGNLRQLGYVVNALQERIETAGAEVVTSEAVAAEARQALENAARDRQVMDRLKNKRHDEHNARELHRDRVQMDEIALGRFTRSHSEQRGNENSIEGAPEG